MNFKKGLVENDISFSKRSKTLNMKDNAKTNNINKSEFQEPINLKNQNVVKFQRSKLTN